MKGIQVYEMPGARISLIASKDFGPDDRYTPVKILQDGTFDKAAAADHVIGILQNEVRKGEAGQIVVSGVSYLVDGQTHKPADVLGKWGTVVVGTGAGKGGVNVCSVLVHPGV